MSKHQAELDAKDTHQQGCATKHTASKGSRCDYRHNGYVESSSGAKRAMYEVDFTVEPARSRLPDRMQRELKSGGNPKIKTDFRTPKNPALPRNKTAWFFKGENYKIGYLPFNHNYHHILPDTSLAGVGVPTLKLLQSAGYNLNGRLNMILLPCTLAYGIALQLPDHPGGHPDYNDDVESVVNEIRAEVKKAAKSHRITNQNKDDLKKLLEGWQEREFKAIVKAGKKLKKGLASNQINKVPIATAVV
jgi:hypothetical protein